MQAEYTSGVSVARKASSTKIKKVIIIVIGLIAFCVFVIISTSHPSHQKNQPDKQEQYSVEARLPETTQLSAYIQNQKPRIETLEKQTADLKQAISNLSQQLAQITLAYEEIKTLIQNQQQKPQAPEKKDGIVKRNPGPEINQEQVARHLVKIKPKSTESKSQDLRTIYLPPGSFVEGILLTGCYAPIQAGPIPVLVEVKEMAIGPNRSRIPIKGAFLIGKAEGDANSSRAIIQFTKLSMIRDDGKVIERDINAYAVDSDGLQGLKGQYVYRLAEVAGPTFLTGALKSISEAFAQTQTTRTITQLGSPIEVVTGEPAKFAAAKGLSEAMGKISSVFERRFNEIIPAVWISNGKKVTAVFLEGVSLMEVEDEKLGMDSPVDGLD